MGCSGTEPKLDYLHAKAEDFEDTNVVYSLMLSRLNVYSTDFIPSL